MTARRLNRIIESMATSDGAGVKLRRSIGASQGARLDPFLMLDEFGTDRPEDYIAGFPAHPHRGFETVTYMLDGHMLHEDHLGNRGDLTPGGVQWMTAGRGIIHSEMPQQTEGRMRGFQLWINLPASQKMKPAGYRDIPADQIPEQALGAHSLVRVIAGRTRIDGEVVGGAINPDGRHPTDPLFLDVHLAPEARFEHPIAAGYSAFLYVYEGDVAVESDGESRRLPHRAAGVLSDGEAVTAVAGPEGTRFILLAARPLNEPVVQYGPFVMNTVEEIERAIRDYQTGQLTA